MTLKCCTLKDIPSILTGQIHLFSPHVNIKTSLSLNSFMLCSLLDKS